MANAAPPARSGRSVFRARCRRPPLRGPGQVASSAELAIRVRRETSRRGEVGRALAEWTFVKTWVMRGRSIPSRPRMRAPSFARGPGRSWECPSWQRYFGMEPKQMRCFAGRSARRSRVTSHPRRPATAVSGKRGFVTWAKGLRSGLGTLLKPLAWEGDLRPGPSQGSRVTFMCPKDVSSRWRGRPDPDEAAAVVIVAYFRGYGPMIIDAFGNWLAGGDFGKRPATSLARRARRSVLGGSTLDADACAYVPAEDLDAPAMATPDQGSAAAAGASISTSSALGPGTAMSSRHRGVPWSSRQSGWIPPAVVVGRDWSAGPGSWTATQVHASWFGKLESLFERRFGERSGGSRRSSVVTSAPRSSVDAAGSDRSRRAPRPASARAPRASTAWSPPCSRPARPAPGRASSRELAPTWRRRPRARPEG